MNAGEPPVSLAVEDGKFAAIGTDIAVPPGSEEIDLGGRVVLPEFIESHIHLDKAYLEERRPNLTGTLEDAIAITLELKKSATAEDIRARSERALRSCLRHGTTRFRVQVEVDPFVELKGMEATLSLREAYRGWADIEIVVFPQEGIEQQPGTEDLMREAMRMGGDVVGGIPYNDHDAERHLDIVFGMAEAFGCGVDLHIDFFDDPKRRDIESAARRTIAAGLQGRVAAGHLTSLGSMDDEQAKKIIGLIVEAGISVIPLPATDLFLGGRGPATPRFRSLTRVKELLAAGANVALSSNNIRNAFTPSGNGDLLEVALLLASAAHMTTPRERALLPEFFTGHAARALGVGENYGIREGCPADFVVLDTANRADVIIDQPEKRYVVKGGRVVAENLRETRWHGVPDGID